MSKENVNELKPFLSILLIVATLFSVVFFKMEVRRMGYSVLKQSREYKQMRDRYRLNVIEYARYTSPSHLRQLAQAELTLTEAKMGQIIQLSGENIAIRQ